MIIRKAEIKDYKEIDLLMQQLHKIHVSGRPDLYIDLEHPYSVEEFENLVENENVICYAAEEDHAVVGFCAATMRNRSNMVEMRTAYIDDMVVDSNYQRKGIAKKLFKTVESEAKKLGAKRVDLMVWEFNKSAIELYRSLGMKPQRYIFEKSL